MMAQSAIASRRMLGWAHGALARLRFAEEFSNPHAGCRLLDRLTL